MNSFRKILVGICLCLASGLLFVNVYTSLVDARSWAAEMPSSILVARTYFKHANPGDFFRVFSPVHQVASLLLAITCWRTGRTVRILAILAFLVAVAADAFTFGYFYPRNEILLHSSDMESAAKAVQEWTAMNWARSGLVAVAVGLYFRLQNLLYTTA